MDNNHIIITKETFEKIKELNIEYNTTDSQLIETAINKLWGKNNPLKYSLIEIKHSDFEVFPKKEYETQLKDLCGKGPYIVEKQVISWINKSKGVYKLKGHDLFLPVSFFSDTAKKSHSLIPLILFLTNLLQSTILLYLFYI